jgi:hypothetical protein
MPTESPLLPVPSWGSDIEPGTLALARLRIPDSSSAAMKTIVGV